jgi:hypothetical protein
MVDINSMALPTGRLNPFLIAYQNYDFFSLFNGIVVSGEESLLSLMNVFPAFTKPI